MQQAHDGRSPLARTQATGEQPVLASQRDGADQVFDAIVVRSQVAVVDEARQRRPTLEAVVDGLGCRAAVGQFLPVGHQPGMQQIGGRPALELADAQPLLPVQVLDLTLHVVEDAEQLQGLFGQGAAVVGPQLVEFTTGMRQAARLGHAGIHGLLVACVVVADQRAAPAAHAVFTDAQEAPRVVTGPALGEVEDDRVDVVPDRGAVAPEVSTVRLAKAGLEHGYRCLVGMQYVPAEQVVAHGLDQWRQLHADGADPLGLRRTGDGHTGATHDGLQAEQRLVVDVLGHDHMRHQAGGGQPLVDDGRWHRRLDKRLAFGAGPLATHMPLDRKAAGQVVELLRDVFADALELAAAARGAAGGVLGLVVNISPWQVWRQGLTFRCVLIGRFLCCVLKLLDLAGQGLEVFVDGLFEQALLLGAEALGGGSKLQPLEHGHLVGELGVERFGVTDLGLKPTCQGADLGQAHAGEGRVDEVCADAGVAVHHGGNDAGDRLTLPSADASIARLQDADHTSLADALPGQSQHERVQLGPGQCKGAAVFRPDEAPGIQPASSQPHTDAVVHQHLHAIGPSVGEQVGMVRSSLTEDLDHPAERRLGAGSHVQRLTGKPHGIHTNHLRTSRVHRANSAAALVGQVMDIVIAPRRSSTRRSACGGAGGQGGAGVGAIVRGNAMNSPVFVVALASPPRASLRQR